jgi:hypothetical protein
MMNTTPASWWVVVKTRDQLDADLASARAKASAAADQLSEKAKDEASAQWQVRTKWQAHVAEVRANIEKKKAEHDVKKAERAAALALVYALDAIDFAQSAIDQAEYAALDALYARAAADSRDS